MNNEKYVPYENPEYQGEWFPIVNYVCKAYSFTPPGKHSIVGGARCEEWWDGFLKRVLKCEAGMSKYLPNPVYWNVPVPNKYRLKHERRVRE